MYTKKDMRKENKMGFILFGPKMPLGTWKSCNKTQCYLHNKLQDND